MLTRLIQPAVAGALAQFPVVGLIGSRQTGKSTLAQAIAAKHKDCVYLDLERPSDLAKLANAEHYLRMHAERLVVIDEVQRSPELFPVLRALIDERRRPGRYLILGSASPVLLRQSSESLAGRIRYLELPQLLFPEILGKAKNADGNIRRLWLRGGYPDSFLAESDDASFVWRQAYLAAFLERDLPQLGFRVGARELRRFMQMLAHAQGGIWNASELARSLGVSAPTASHYLEIVANTLTARILEPFHANLKKRLVKSPRTYIRDSGLLHALLQIADQESLAGHPVLGRSFEGFAIEQILGLLATQPGFDASFYRTRTGEELDLVVTHKRRRFAVEIKYGQPLLSKDNYRALEAVKPAHVYVVTADGECYDAAAGITVVPLRDVSAQLFA